MNRQQRRQGAQGGGGSPFGADFLQKAQELQNQVMKAQAEFESASVDATAGGGAVKVVLLGSHKVQSIEIDREVVDPDDVDMLQDLIIAAFNECVDKLEAKRNEVMGPLAGGLKMPGL